MRRGRNASPRFDDNLKAIRPRDDVLRTIGIERLRAMGNRGRQDVMQHHDYRELGRRYARLLDRLVEGKGT
jgi:hypothetical protein